MKTAAIKTLPMALALLAGVSYSSQAQLTITAGDFNDSITSPNDIKTPIPGWFESNVNTSYGLGYNDYTTISASHFSTDKTRKLALDWGTQNGSGYVYQSMGTYSGEASVTLYGDSLIRDFLGRTASSVGKATFSLWDLPSSTAGPNGTPVGSLAGALSVDSWTVDCSLLTYAGDTSFFSHTFNLSGSGVGDNIWLQIASDPSNTHEVMFDNLSTSVPEPASATLLGIAGAGLIVMRRRKA